MERTGVEEPLKICRNVHGHETESVERRYDGRDRGRVRKVPTETRGGGSGPGGNRDGSHMRHQGHKGEVRPFVPGLRVEEDVRVTHSGN